MTQSYRIYNGCQNPLIFLLPELQITLYYITIVHGIVQLALYILFNHIILFKLVVYLHCIKGTPTIACSIHKMQSFAIDLFIPRYSKAHDHTKGQFE